MDGQDLKVLQGRVKTIKGLSEDKEIRELSSIIINLIDIITKEEAGFKK